MRPANARFAYHPGMRVQAVFLDLDDTLLDNTAGEWTQTVRTVCAQLSDRASDGAHSLNPEALFLAYMRITSEYFRAAQVRYELVADGHVVWRDWWRQSLAECGYAGEALADVAVIAYESDRAARYTLYSDVLPTLSRLREQVPALVLITNGLGSTQRHKADATGLTALMDAVIISGEAGVAKPDPAIFGLAADAAGVPLAAAWHVGDNLSTDIAGARNACLGAGVWLNRAGAAHPGEPITRPDYEIAGLADLPALLAESSPAGKTVY